jgi:hypothetical protein
MVPFHRVSKLPREGERDPVMLLRVFPQKQFRAVATDVSSFFENVLYFRPFLEPLLAREAKGCCSAQSFGLLVWFLFIGY